MFLGPTITYDLDYGTYYGQYGVIENPRVGFMRDGVFLGASFGWKGNGSGVGSVADYTFDEYDKELEERTPTVAFGYWIRDILKVMGVDSWEALKGRPVMTLWDEKNSWGGTCKGIANPATDKYILWDQWWDEAGKPLIEKERGSVD